jgi:hypothetical protein
MPLLLPLLLKRVVQVLPRLLLLHPLSLLLLLLRTAWRSGCC